MFNCLKGLKQIQVNEMAQIRQREVVIGAPHLAVSSLSSCPNWFYITFPQREQLGIPLFILEVQILREPNACFPIESLPLWTGDPWPCAPSVFPLFRERSWNIGSLGNPLIEQMNGQTKWKMIVPGRIVVVWRENDVWIKRVVWISKSNGYNPLVMGLAYFLWQALFPPGKTRLFIGNMLNSWKKDCRVNPCKG